MPLLHERKLKSCRRYLLAHSLLAFLFCGATKFGGKMTNKVISFISTNSVSFSGKFVTVSGDAPQFTLLSSDAVQRTAGETQAFEVKFLTKDKKTAIGFTATKLENINTYLTPDFYSSHNDYVSMGGAGYFYPSRSRATRGYANGDTVRVEINFTTTTVSYIVNGVSVGSAELRCTSTGAGDSGGDVLDAVYPFISCEGGPIVMEIVKI